MNLWAFRDPLDFLLLLQMSLDPASTESQWGPPVSAIRTAEMEQEHSNGCLTAPDLGISPGTALQKQQSQSWGPGFFCPTLAVT